MVTAATATATTAIEDSIAANTINKKDYSAADS